MMSSHGLGPCNKCATTYGPCVQDSDCMDGNVCVNDPNTCKNYVVPCCQKGTGKPMPRKDVMPPMKPESQGR